MPTKVSSTASTSLACVTPGFLEQCFHRHTHACHQDRQPTEPHISGVSRGVVETSENFIRGSEEGSQRDHHTLQLKNPSHSPRGQRSCTPASIQLKSGSRAAVPVRSSKAERRRAGWTKRAPAGRAMDCYSRAVVTLFGCHKRAGHEADLSAWASLFRCIPPASSVGDAQGEDSDSGGDGADVLLQPFAFGQTRISLERHRSIRVARETRRCYTSGAPDSDETSSSSSDTAGSESVEAEEQLGPRGFKAEAECRDTTGSPTPMLPSKKSKSYSTPGLPLHPSDKTSATSNATEHTSSQSLGPPSASDGDVFPLDDLPESVLPDVFKHLRPLDILRASAVCRAFHVSCQMDLVWQQHLPKCANNILEAAYPNCIEQSSAIDCARALAQGVVLDRGLLKMVWSPSTGRLRLGVCISEASRVQLGGVFRRGSRQDWVRTLKQPRALFDVGVMLKHSGGYLVKIRKLRLPTFLPPGRYSVGWRARGSGHRLLFCCGMSATIAWWHPDQNLHSLLVPNAVAAGGNPVLGGSDEEPDGLCTVEEEIAEPMRKKFTLFRFGELEMPDQTSRGDGSVLVLSATITQRRTSPQPDVYLDSLVLEQVGP